MILLKAATAAELCRHAQEAYPLECCGVVLNGPQGEQVRRCSNIQDRLHREDPEKYPRDARIAYYMDPEELYRIFKETDQSGTLIKAFYHSHPDHEAYFSAEDKERGTAWGEPLHPDTTYVVVSLFSGTVKGMKAFAWDSDKKDFTEILLETDSSE
ncbi:MAG TPA: M67 family metallopeptidase [bacterium]|nr:M67 family metallopeptidase [bacterium]